ncbi:MAG: YggS family pyridoxal phosphate-dependent enzyme, partial [Elusimicrobiota bacterium]
MPTAELTRKSALLSNFQNITGRIAAACGRAGVDPSTVELLAVTKYAEVEDVKILIEAGAVKTVGENKVRDARAKWVNGRLASLKSSVKLHFIGHLQTNKAKAAVETFDWIDSIDSLKIAAEISRHAVALGRTMPVMIQLKLNNSAAQSGVTTDKAEELLAGIRNLKNLEPRGYMGIAPEGASPAELKAVFSEA